MKNFLIIGDYESIVMYKLYGWEVFYINPKNIEFEEINKILKSKKYDKIFIIEDFYKTVQNKLYTELEKAKIPIIPLPGINSTKNISKQKYKKLASIATGIKLE